MVEIAAIVVGVALVAVALLYNRLVRLRVRADHAWAQVDAQLQRRHDLVPALVSTVAGYASHERTALEAVTSARAEAAAVADPAERAAREDALGAAVARLLALGEDQPQLRADERFQVLQGELTDTEDRIAFARGFANDRVRRYREAISAFPGLLVARPFGFHDRPMFDVDPDGRAVPAIEQERPA